MNEFYLYRIFGLIVASQCECPELMPADEALVPDVHIRWGAIPEHLNSAVVIGRWLEARSLDMLIRSNVASYRIENGEQITIQPVEGASLKDIRLYLLGSVMGAILHQRGLLPFHGSSIVSESHAVTFSGTSGMGKSTLAATMVKRGYHILADDVSAISFDGKQAMVNPGMPQLKLRPDTMDQLGFDKIPDEWLGQSAEKYGYSTHAVFITKPCPVTHIYILDRHPENRFEVVPLKGIDKFHALRINTYRPYFVKAMEIEKSHFDLLGKLAESVNVSMLLRPDEGFQIEKLADFVETLI